jgi:hypothetical protein
VLGALEAGHLGCPVSACLHWGLKRGPDYLDPARWVTGGPVRLLPVDGTSSDAGAGVAPRSAAGAAVSGPVPATVPPDRPAGASPVTGATTARSTRAGPARADPALPDRPEAEPSWSLRSAEAPLGAAAVAALVAGIGLLARPRPPSPEPVSGGAATPVPALAEDDVGPSVELVDLDAARLRRQSG